MEKLNKSELESFRLLIYPMTVTTASVSGMEKHIVKATSWRWKRFRVELSHYNNQISYHPPRNCGPFLSFTTIFFLQKLKTKKMLDAGSLPMVVCQKVRAWWTAGHCSQVIAHFFIIPSFFTQFHFFKKIHFVANNTISAKFSCLDNLRIILLSQVSSWCEGRPEVHSAWGKKRDNRCDNCCSCCAANNHLEVIIIF